jgi:hypothetical protein
VRFLALKVSKLSLQFLELLQSVIPAPLERACDEAIGGIDLLVAALSELRFVLRSFQTHPPLLACGFIPLFKLPHRLKSNLELGRPEHLQNTP